MGKSLGIRTGIAGLHGVLPKYVKLLKKLIVWLYIL